MFKDTEQRRFHARKAYMLSVLVHVLYLQCELQSEGNDFESCSCSMELSRLLKWSWRRYPARLHEMIRREDGRLKSPWLPWVSHSYTTKCHVI